MNLWDWKAKNYDRYRSLFPLRWLLYRELENIRALLFQIKLNQGPILDVGTGTGTALDLFPNSTTTVAVDSSLNMIKIARRKKACYFVVADALALPFKNSTFELVTAVGIFEYLSNQAAFLEEAKRVCEAAGYVLLTLSQLNMFNLFRLFLAQPLRLLTYKNFINKTHRAGFNCLLKKKSLMQFQVLLQRSTG